ncbi:MAG: hypothetical protein M1832_004697 [Thelocarpon impressellum]|nr:MAG: hypothetical protein M1832_004697 [Thelocarpon impressellum]
MATPSRALLDPCDDDEDLSYDAIQQLLQDAEQRMRARVAQTPLTLAQLLVYSSDRIKQVQDPEEVKEKLRKDKESTAGSDWFDLPRTRLTSELKRDLQLLRMRSVLDPKRHYKKTNSSKASLVPEYSQVGTVVEGPTEFFSARIPNKERKKTFVEEVLTRDDTMSRFKRKYDDVQKSKTSGKKAYYQQLQAKRKRRIGTR